MILLNRFINLYKKIVRMTRRGYYHIVNLLLMKLNGVSVGHNFTGNGKLMIINFGEINLGNDITINSASYINPVGTERTRLCALENAKIIIGNNVGISNALIHARESIVIEDNVMIGAESMIVDSDFHAISYEERMREVPQVGAIMPVKIEEGVFIAAHVIVLKGVTIGARSVVGAGSVVTKDIPSGELWAGNPARFIRKIDNGVSQ